MHIIKLMALGAVASAAHAEIITGDFPSQYLPSVYDDNGVANSYVEELDIYFLTTSTSHNFMTWTSFFLEWDLDDRFFIWTDTDSFVNPQYELGDVISQGVGGDGLIGFSEDIGPDAYSVSMGEIGEALFIGFSLNQYNADLGTYDYNFGFFELVKEDEFRYSVVGWAYETETNRDLRTFNIPAPSGVALLGLSGLVATRRRR